MSSSDKDSLKMDKAAYFDQLYSLKDSSDEEEDTNDTRQFLQHKKPAMSSSFPTTSPSSPEKRNRVPNTLKKVPAIHRATSAPLSSVSIVKETPPLLPEASLLRCDISTSEVSDSSFIKEPHLPGHTPDQRANPERRTVSTPIIGSVVMTNSTGINFMLKKRKRKPSITLVPEKDRIFQDLVFYWLPPDDVNTRRQSLINKAKSFGATWTKDWVPGITHIVVDKDLTYQSLMKHLKSDLKIDSLPSDILVVNESYSIACTQSRRLFDAKQKLYAVKGSEATSEIQEPQPVTSQPSDESLQVKQRKSKKGGNIPQSPTRSQESMQGQLELPPGLWLSQAESEGEHQLDQSPRESSPAPNFQAPAKYGDELDAMIETARKLQYLPLDDGDDDDDSRPSSSDGPEDPVDLGSDDERAAAVAAKKKRKTTKGSFNQDNFSCMSGGTGITLESNPNRRTIEILQEMCEHYERTDNTWRYRAYRVAIGMLKKQSVLIANRDQAMDIRGIGTRLADKIVEIVTDGRLRRLEYAKQEPNDQILQIFLKVYGVGLSQANKWIQNGHKTLDDLKQKVDLTENQRTGIERYDDFNTRIPREEVTALGEVVKGVAETIDHKVEVIIGGSYRRGAPNSGDIDFILTKPRTTSSQELMPFLNSLIDRLTSTGFLVAPLAVSRNESGTKWHGACVLPGAPKQIWRRIDFLLVPESELGAALIYFTGDDIFNRSIRLLSSTKGMRLNQRGLYKDIMRGPGRVKFNEGALIEGADEKKIFDALGVPWRPPEHRICH